MSPTAMLILIFAAFAMFAWSASRRWHLLLVGRPVPSAIDHVGTRLRGTWRFAFRQEKMDYYNPAGVAHKRESASRDLLVIGSYPQGQRPDICQADRATHDKSAGNVARVALPACDPVTGQAGPLLDCWRRGGSL